MGTGTTQNLLVFHHVSSSSVSFFPLPGPICDAFRQMYLMEPPKKIINTFVHLRGYKGSPVLQKPGPISRSIYSY